MKIAPRRVAQTTVLTSRPFSVVNAVFESIDGHSYERAIVEHPGAVVIVPITDRGSVLLVRQFRAAVGEVLLELPAGTIERGEAPEYCAERELQEEVGFRPGKLLKLGELYPAPGFCSERQYCFAASDLVMSRRPADEDEDIEVVDVTVAELSRLAVNGELRDGKTLALIFLAKERGLLS